MEPIIVTGSYIPTTDTEGPSPVTTITAADIDKHDDRSVTDALSRLPAVGSFSDKGYSPSGFNGAGAYVSLRGLGPQATLVLINGRRTAPFGETANGQYSFVDLNSIAIQDVDRIEVLSDGASAIYGADAVAGVVNIILKDHLDSDAETTVNVGNTTQKDAFEQDYSQLFSLDSLDKHGHGIVGLDFYQRNAIYQRDRPYSTTSNLTERGGYDLRSFRTYPGLFYGSDPATQEYDGFSINPGYGKAPLTASSPAEDTEGNYFIPYDYNPNTVLVPSTTRYGFTANYAYDFYDGNVKPSIDFSYRHLKTYFDQAASGYADGDIVTPAGDYVPLIIPNGSYYNHSGQDILVDAYRFTEAGDRFMTDSTDDFRAVPQVDIKLAKDWILNAGFNYSYSFTDQRETGMISVSKLEAALASTDPSTAYDMFTNGASNSPGVINSLLTKAGNHAWTSMVGEDARINGTLFTLPGGPALIVLGIENRLERFNQVYDAADNAGDVLSEAAQQNIASSRNVTSGYSEVDIPIFGPGFELPGAHALDVYFAGRVDNYNDFGLTENPEVLFRYEPVPGLVLRGSYATSFRAPSLTELYANGNDAYAYIDDPTPPAGYPTEYEVLLRGVGNINLKPEESEQFSGGIAYSPSFVPGLEVHADIYKIRYTGEIVQEDPQTVVDQGGGVRSPDGAIILVTTPFENYSSSIVKGIDFGFSYIWGDPNKEFGQFDLEYQGSWLFNYLTSTPGYDGYTENAGADSGGLGAYPRYRHTASLFWYYHGFSFGVSNDFTSGVDDSLAIDPAGDTWLRSIGSYSTFDLQASYTFKEHGHDVIGGSGADLLSWLDGTKVTVGCDNVAQFTPPFAANPDNAVAGSDSAYADYRGRFVYAQIKKDW